MKNKSMFFAENKLQTLRDNVTKTAWSAGVREQAIDAASYWMNLSDDELWSLMFGNTIRRSWMVWSSGYCPSCRQDVPMYAWVMNGFEHPWKTKCPHCNELFPKNDYKKFYDSGLDERGVFQYELADRSLLFHADHPDPADPLHKYGVDDGEGDVDEEKGHRWRFIGTYLIYGHWKQLLVRGVMSLADAYVITGGQAYAHKAGVLLDRIADLYPTFDFGKEGVMYEGAPWAGYVSTWHDACRETMDLALCYDKVFEALQNDEELIRFLRRKAGEFRLSNAKESFADVQRNIEEGLLRDPLANIHKIHSNYPWREITLITLKSVLDWPARQVEVMTDIDDVIAKATATDGVTGEKGMTVYSSAPIRSFGELLALFDRQVSGFLEAALDKHPKLAQTFRFFIDTWCLEKYYPRIGDSGEYVQFEEQYIGLQLERGFSLKPSMFTFLWSLYKLTGDADYIKIMYKSNGYTAEHLPYDHSVEDPDAFEAEIERIIAEEGAQLRVPSSNKQDWHLALLRSGQGVHERVLWINYDSGYAHGHQNGMNIGLFAKGLDILPDFGYPPVHYGGGWSDPKVMWYFSSAAHNTVVIDGNNHKKETYGKTTMWVIGDISKAIRVDGRDIAEGEQFERTIVMNDISAEDSYIVDIFRVASGSDHTRFLRTQPGDVTTSLRDDSVNEYGYGTIQRSFRGEASAAQGWNVDIALQDRFGLLLDHADVHLQITDLTSKSEAYVGESWINSGGFNKKEEAWVPTVMVRRTMENGGSASTFVSVIEPYEGHSNLTSVRRVELWDEAGAVTQDCDAAIEIGLSNGKTDCIVSRHADRPRIVMQNQWGMRTDAEYVLVRRSGADIEHIVLSEVNCFELGSLRLNMKQKIDFIELGVVDGRLAVMKGDSAQVEITEESHT